MTLLYLLLLAYLGYPSPVWAATAVEAAPVDVATLGYIAGAVVSLVGLIYGYMRWHAAQLQPVLDGLATIDGRLHPIEIRWHPQGGNLAQRLAKNEQDIEALRVAVDTSLRARREERDAQKVHLEELLKTLMARLGEP